jgi:hypothetical protein
MSKTIEDARQRTRAVRRKLQDVETAPLDDPEDVLHLKDEGGFGGDGTSPPTLDLA